jgi:predicted DNA-binding transcriptional regulator AlpA
MNTTTKFAELVDRASVYDRIETERPMPKRAMAKELGISRAHLYALMAAKHAPMPHIKARLIRGFSKMTGLKPGTVRRWLEADWEVL